jgi:WD40 repeat protein
MGVVLKALDPALRRVVAIKVLAPQLAGSATARKRFLREGRAAAAVAHEHVVPIYEVGEAAGLPYLVMQYVAGVSLQEKLDAEGPLPVSQVLRIGKQVAEGLAAAHAQGLVHRDVKPANILLEDGVEHVKLTDFGLAQAGDDDGCTVSGVVTGTPAYMAPEQARAEPHDARADLFSLGSVLYALCTGHSPFGGGSALAVLRRVSDEAPRPLREVNPHVPDWLEEIVTTLHAKEPKNRFRSAAEVALLLGRHLSHLQQPTAVAPPPRLGAPHRTRPRSQRRRQVGAAVFLAVLAVGVAWFLAAVTGVGRPRAAGEVLTTPRTFWVVETGQGVACGAVSADGKTLACGSWDGTGVVYDAATGKERVRLPGFVNGLRALAISPDGNTVATATSDKVVRLWDATDGEKKKDLTGHVGRVMALAFSPDGKTLASAGGDFRRAGELKLWDLATGKARVQVTPFPRELWGLAYAADGKSVAVAVGDGTARTVDTTTGKRLASFMHTDYVRRVAYSPDGRLLATTHGEAGGVTLWEVSSGRQWSAFQAQRTPLFDLRFSPDGKRLATASSDGTAVVWDVRRPHIRPAFTLKADTGTVWFAVFFPGGRTVATGGGERTIRLWTVGEEKKGVE